MQTVVLIDNPMEPATWERVEVEDVRPFIVARYPEWPAGARIYSGPIGDDHDVTPSTPGDVERLATLPELAIVIFPEAPILIIAAIVVAIVAIAAVMFLLPSIPDMSNAQNTSPNNSLAERGNRARPNARIPDIFGTVRSIPDLIGQPYRVYENHREVEIATMCIGRGSYAISDVRDGDTDVASIQGASVSIYAPFTSPNSGASPQLQIGTAISDPLFNVVRSNDVNGQVLKAPNDTAVRADQEIRFKDGGIVEAAGGSIDFTQYFHAGDSVDIGNATDTGQTANANAIFAAATAVAPNKFVFATFDPSAHFEAGQEIVIAQAVYTWTDGTGSGGSGGSGGDIPGSEDNPDYPWRYRVPNDLSTEP
jgi:hypothetical protein